MEKMKKNKTKKTVDKVKKVFKTHPELKRVEQRASGVKISKKLIGAIAGSVRVNKALIKKDEDALKSWREEYYQKVYKEFKLLVSKINNDLKFDLTQIERSVEEKRKELILLQKEIKKLKKQKKKELV